MKALIISIAITIVSFNANTKSICDYGLASEKELKSLEAKQDELSKLLLSMEKDAIESQDDCNELLNLEFNDLSNDPLADLLNTKN
jgi:predicted secreted protein